MLAYFKAYADFDALTVEITDAEKANLLLMAYRYATTGAEPVFVGNDRFYWAMMKAQIDRDQDSYDKKVSAGKEGGDAKAKASTSKQSLADASTEKQTLADASTAEQNLAPFKNKTKEQDQEQEQDQDVGTVARASAIDRRFAAFWAAYPKKVGKQDALRAFARLKVGEDQLGAMLAAIEQQRASPQWAKDGGQYIPNPATWLRQGRWEDEPLSASPPQSDAARLLAMAERYAEMGV